jgi:hypothetical protein
MDVRMAFVLFACRIVFDVDELLVEVVGVSYAVFVIAAVPDFSWGCWRAAKEYPPLMY